MTDLEIECPSDVIDQIGGWRTAGVGHRYGNGYSLAQTYRWIVKIDKDNDTCTDSGTS